MIRFILIGFGRMGRLHYRALKQITGVSVQAVCDPSPDETPVEPFFLSFDDLIKNTDFDAAVIASPSRHHAAMAQHLIRMGKHLLIEKPVAVNLPELRELHTAGTGAPVQVCTSFTERFNPVIQALRERVRNQNLMSITINRTGPYSPKKAHDGVLLDLAVHDIDLSRFLTEDEFARIEIEIKSKAHNGITDMADIRMMTSRDNRIRLRAEWHSQLKIRRIKIRTASCTYCGDLINLRLTQRSSTNENPVTVDVFEEPVLAQMRAFIEYIRTGVARNIATLDDGIKAIEALSPVLKTSE